MKFRCFKFYSVVFLSLFSVCFKCKICVKCKICFKTYGVHHNKNFDHKISLSHGTAKGGSGPLRSQRLRKWAFFNTPLTIDFSFLHYLIFPHALILHSFCSGSEMTFYLSVFLARYNLRLGEITPLLSCRQKLIFSKG